MIPVGQCVKVGELYKVYLPGETPWAECLALHEDGTWEGRIDNKLIGSMTEAERAAVAADMFPGSIGFLPSLHNFKENDVVRFAWKHLADGYWAWQPVEIPSGRA
jgi:hypothetical protein